jgi:AcrR family transcriptional regulator
MARTIGSAAEDTRRRILATASDLFLERGYAGTSIRDISQRLGMTKGSLYYHFAAKEDLLIALLAPLFEAVEAFVVAARASGRVTHELVRRLVDVLDEHATMLRSFTADPAVSRMKTERGVPAGFVDLLEILGGAADGATMLRARCALGVIHAGVIAGDPAPVPSERLTEAEKEFVTAAAIAVLAVPTGR